MERLDTKRLETIDEFALAPWDERVQATYEADRVETMRPDDPEDITIATSSSQRKGKVGLGGVVRDASCDSADGVLASYSVTLGPSDEQNAYTAGLEAIATALRCVPLGLRDRDLTVVTSNRSVLQVIGRPRQQSGQCTIREIYGSVEYLGKRGCRVRLRWVPAKNEEFTLGPLAKMQAKRATRDECSAEPATFQARSTTLRLLLNEHARVGQIPERVGKYSKRIDKALPGKRGCRVRLRWVPAKNEEFTLGPLAKMQAKRATRDECVAEPATFQARSTTLRLLLNGLTRVRQIAEGVGKYSKRIDKALPGKHTRKLFELANRG
ncbi:hypothetical protein HIM_10752 [Hirsutella minnesotensis 3608]|uniref:RNase H type-1 domain-containing protein n=1 Tax=Hirsutella minnesotensis 3608 TaxID=1043627 RepID=A0A0F7ZWZ9_9HYPO|nr:hypothetical protein HIM_10752 [Hirsutella minnesotensis 3608]